MLIIGITGGTGSGKTIAVHALQTLGALALDCDEIYHELLLSSVDMKAEIEAHFENVSTDGAIDRQKLGEIVWNDPASLQELNIITHKYVNSEIERRINTFIARDGKIAAVDAIALIESGQSSKCDIVVGVIAPPEKRLTRIMKRDKLTKEYAQMRINAQQPDSYYTKNCDYILENTYDTQTEFEDKCLEFFNEMIRRNKFE